MEGKEERGAICCNLEAKVQYKNEQSLSEELLQQALKKTKLLALDVDGVLNNRHTRTRTGEGWCFVDDFLVDFKI